MAGANDYPRGPSGVSNISTTSEAARVAAAASWLAAVGEPCAAIEPLIGDVSPRRYFRLRRPHGDTAIVAWYPAKTRDACSRWLASGSLLTAAEVRVPRTLRADCAAGWMVLEDLGDATLYEWSRGRSWDDLAPHLESAAAAAARICRLDSAAVAAINPPLDGESLRRELDQTWELLLEPAGLAGPAALAERLRPALWELAASLGGDPPAPCHRDLMARNLVPLADGQVGLLDHQDLRLGPPFYDLASLLNDSLYPGPEVEARVTAPYLARPVDRRRYHRAAAQRALKIAGTFEALRRGGHDRHAPLIAPSLAAARRHLAALPETAGLAAELTGRW